MEKADENKYGEAVKEALRIIAENRVLPAGFIEYRRLRSVPRLVAEGFLQMAWAPTRVDVHGAVVSGLVWPLDSDAGCRAFFEVVDDGYAVSMEAHPTKQRRAHANNFEEIFVAVERMAWELYRDEGRQTPPEWVES